MCGGGGGGEGGGDCTLTLLKLGIDNYKLIIDAGRYDQMTKRTNVKRILLF